MSHEEEFVPLLEENGVAYDAEYLCNGRCDRSGVGTMRPAVPRVARGLVCTRLRATHGYFIDRSAVADSTAPRLRTLQRCRARNYGH